MTRLRGPAWGRSAFSDAGGQALLFTAYASIFTRISGWMRALTWTIGWPGERGFAVVELASFDGRDSTVGQVCWVACGAQAPVAGA